MNNSVVFSFTEMDANQSTESQELDNKNEATDSDKSEGIQMIFLEM